MLQERAKARGHPPECADQTQARAGSPARALHCELTRLDAQMRSPIDQMAAAKETDPLG